MRQVLILSALITAVSPAHAADPLTKEQLLELVEKKVDTSLILNLIEAECVDFDVDAEVLLELSDVVPVELLKACMECRERIHSLESEFSPPGTDTEASEIALSGTAPYGLSAIKTVAVVPIVLDGVADPALTAAFQQQLQSRAPKYTVKDAVALQVHFEDTGAFHSNAPLKSLLAAARTVGAQAIFLGYGASGRVLGYPSIRLDVKLIEVNRGEVLWIGGGVSKGGAWSEQQARKVASRNAVKNLP